MDISKSKTFEQASKSLTDLANRHHALVFHNSRYINEDIMLLANHPGSHGFICVTFYTSGDHEQIYVTNTEINICGFSEGRRYDNTRFLQGEIASIEIYHGKGKPIPQAVRDLVIKNQLIESKDIGYEEPPVKEKKI